MCCLMAKRNDMKKIFAVLTFIGICLGAINSSAQSDSTSTRPTNVKSHHERHDGRGHHRGFRLFHIKHHRKHDHHDHGKKHGHRGGDSKNKQDQSKK